MNTMKRMISEYFPEASDRIYFLCGVFMLSTEIWKQLLLTFSVGAGRYNLWYLPFQLCSMPMYVLLAYPWFRREKIRRALLCFLMCYCLLGGTAAFADTSGMHYAVPALTVHSYLWHVLLILIGIGSGILYARKYAGFPEIRGKILFSRRLASSLHARPFLHATALYLICCGIAEILNLALDPYGNINMFYINPDYEMRQVVFCRLVPLLGNGGAILLYIAATVLGAFLLFLLWHAVTGILFQRRRRS